MTPTSKWSKAFWVDLLERAGATLVGALLAMLTLTGTTPVDWTDAAAVWAVLGVPTVVSVLKGLAANLADPESGASLVPAPPGPVVNEEAGRTDALYVALVVLVVVVILILVF